MNLLGIVLAAALSFCDYAAGVRENVKVRIDAALAESAHAAAVSGTVTSVTRDFFFLQQGDEGVKVVSAESVAVGEVVSVSGSPVIEGGRVIVSAEKIRRSGRTAIPPPRKLSMDDLIYSDSGRRDANWMRVVLAGRAIGRTESGFALSVEGVPVTVVIDPLPPELGDCADTHPKVLACGVLEQVTDSAVLLSGEGEVLGLRLYADSRRDVTLVPDLAYLARRRDGIVRRLLTWSVPLLALALVVFVVAVVRQRRRIFRTRTVMAERRRMADDLHDTIEQHLVGAKMLVQLGRAKEATDVLVRAKQEIRDIVWGLKNDDMMRLAPAEMLRKVAHDETAKGLCRVDTKLDSGLPSSLDASRMRDLSLIVREAIGNAIKHGGARHVAIASDAPAGGGWRLRVANDGTPFDPAKAPGAAEGHFGLEGMRERARRLGGTVVLAARKEGMVVTLEVAQKAAR